MALASLHLGSITGPWVGASGGATVPVKRAELLSDGSRVYIIDDVGFCKMVSDRGECRYYAGDSSTFSPDVWAASKQAPRNVYILLLAKSDVDASDKSNVAAILPPGPKTIIIVGAGNRGNIYARYALENPDKLRVIGVAEPREFARDAVREAHGIAADMCFPGWEALVGLGRRIADAVIITTQDAMHVEPAVACAALGYAILLEKPMAPDAEGCRRIVEAVKRHGVLFAVGHVLRYTPLTQLQVRQT